MKTTQKYTNSMKHKVTRKYTCTRRVNKEGRKIWVVLEDGRVFYRIFRNRSLAINYFVKLKTIYAEMLVQDLVDNVFSRIVFTKLETVKKGLIKDFEDFFGGIVEDSDTLFDEDMFNLDKKKPVVKEDDDSIEGNESPMVYDFSFVDDLFPQKEPLIKPIKISIDLSKQSKANHKMISDESSIKIYQSDLELSYYVLGDKFYEEREKIVEPE